MQNHHYRALLALETDSYPVDAVEEALRVQEKILEEIECDRLEQDRRDRELDIQALKGDIEMLLREEYESKWQEAMVNA